ncbi:YrhK family protein [uncultured Pseudosulfitobacter sp.]|uniref:YrhK family protein n=1 Tax=uncultured Pseudosulfitobacter sp. TaxID=2854214 RepID=UPI0030DCF945|tara:strand:+ start:5314 stop:5595 length:282 start_codon:yes stop_codon:yes gene_type:complete
MLFRPDQHTYSEDDLRRYAAFEIVYTLIDFAAAGLFLIGSIMFLSEAWQTPGTWLFIAGSVLFATKPTLRLIRELRLAAAGDAKDLGARFKND